MPDNTKPPFDLVYLGAEGNEVFSEIGGISCARGKQLLLCSDACVTFKIPVGHDCWKNDTGKDWKVLESQDVYTAVEDRLRTLLGLPADTKAVSLTMVYWEWHVFNAVCPTRKFYDQLSILLISNSFEPIKKGQRYPPLQSFV